MVSKAIEAYGRLDGAFNNAGLPQSGKAFEKLDIDDMLRAYNVKTLGVFICMQREIKAILETGGGAIVNTASAVGLVVFPNGAEYVASKHAVVGLSRAVALEYAPRGIRINALCPSATLTPMLKGAMAADFGLEEYLIGQQPIRRLAEPSELALSALWMLSDEASFMTDSAMSVDGGYTAG